MPTWEAVLFRRLVILATILFVVAAVMSATTTQRRPPAERSLEPPRVLASGPHDLVQGELPKDKVVTAHVGDVVELSITSKTSDEAYIENMGIDVPVEPDVPGTLRLVAERAGDYPVRLMWAQKRVGVVEVVDVR